MDSQRYELSEAFHLRSVEGASFIFPPGIATVSPSERGYSFGLGNHEPVDIAAAEMDRILAAVRAITLK
jgi:hypothetical protein